MLTLASLDVGDGDELILVDNTAEGTALAIAAPPTVRVVAAPEQQSSYFARNTGAEASSGEWLLFVDDDTRPGADLLAAYFSPAPDPKTGAVAGAVAGDPTQSALVARYARARGHLDQALNQDVASRPFGVTANLLVRRQAWSEVGGFLDGIRSGGDGDFCFRLQEVGWAMEFRPTAGVEHKHRETVAALVRQMVRYGAGRAWLNRRHPGFLPGPPSPLSIPCSVAGALRWLLAGERERSSFRMLDAVAVAADGLGYLGGNGVSPPGPSADVVMVLDAFPRGSETFISEEARALERLGYDVRVEAAARPVAPARALARGLWVSYREDDGAARKLLDLAALVSAHPVRSARDLRGQRRWRAEEPVPPLRALAPVARRIRARGERRLHAHFAAAAGLDALRLGRLLGVRAGITAHAYEIFQRPANLEEKLRGAAYVSTGCLYNVRYLRELLGPPADAQVHEIRMGVDGNRFRRSTPYPDGSTVAAVGRLVEKKGFADLIEAVALMPEEARPERVVIAGEGPLGDELRELAEQRGVSDRVKFAGALSHAQIRELLEDAALLAMPCVVAADGDRDSMPVVVKEALAMEVPVVATDEVALPEV
ncbi:MAG: glycosyltransferase, partial [Thermoleophilaceae bacterium]|nr:glycosyltransferase [Thermoleophilaceae bacterium]